MGDRFSRSTTTGMLAHALCATGQLVEAEQAAAVARDLTGEGDVFSQVLWRTATAKVFSRSRRLEEAQLLADEAVAVVAPSDWLCIRADVLLDQAEVLNLAGRHADALSAIEEAVRLYKRKGDTASVTRAQKFNAQGSSA
jgi:tetratricopeptide (TPR) repeat protein